MASPQCRGVWKAMLVWIGLVGIKDGEHVDLTSKRGDLVNRESIKMVI